MSFRLAYDLERQQALDPELLTLSSGWAPKFAYAEQRQLQVDFYCQNAAADLSGFSAFRGALALLPDDGGTVLARLEPAAFQLTSPGRLEVALNTATAPFAAAVTGRLSRCGQLEIIGCDRQNRQQRLARFPVLLESLADPDIAANAPELAELAITSAGLAACLADYPKQMRDVTDTATTSAVINVLSGGVRRIYTRPLTSLTVSAVSPGAENEVLFTADSAGVTVDLPSELGLIPAAGLTFLAGTSYLLNFSGGIAVVAAYQAGDPAV